MNADKEFFLSSYTSAFICVHLWTYYLSTHESKPDALPDQVATNTIYRYSVLIVLFYDQVS